MAIHLLFRTRSPHDDLLSFLSFEHEKSILKVKFYLRRFIQRPIGFDKFEAAKDVIYKDRIK